MYYYLVFFSMNIVFYLEPIIHNVTSSAVSLNNITVLVAFLTDGACMHLHLFCKIFIPVYSSLSQNDLEGIELDLHTSHAYAYTHFISVDVIDILLGISYDTVCLLLLTEPPQPTDNRLNSCHHWCGDRSGSGYSPCYGLCLCDLMHEVLEE